MQKKLMSKFFHSLLFYLPLLLRWTLLYFFFCFKRLFLSTFYYTYFFRFYAFLVCSIQRKWCIADFFSNIKNSGNGRCIFYIRPPIFLFHPVPSPPLAPKKIGFCSLFVNVHSSLFFFFFFLKNYVWDLTLFRPIATEYTFLYNSDLYIFFIS